MKPNSAKIIYGTIHVENMSTSEPQYQPFSDEVKRNIENRNAIAVIDASVKNRQMGGYWVISNVNKI